MVGVEQTGTIRLNAAPAFAIAPTAEELRALDLLRVTLRESADGSVVDRAEQAIDATQDAQWSIEISLELTPGQGLSLFLETELVDTDAGSVEWSGKTLPFTVQASLDPFEIRQIDLYRGPLANLGLTGVSFALSDLVLSRGGSMTLEWSLEGDTDGTVLYFGSDDVSIASVDSNGRVSAHATGTTTVVVVGGRVSDSITLTVSDLTLPSLAEIEATVMPQIDYVTGDLFIGTFEDPQGAEAIRGSVAALGSALRAEQAHEALDRYGGAVGAWDGYGAGTELRWLDGPQLGVIELTLRAVANILRTGFP